MDVDACGLISLVENEAVLWDKTLEQYKDKNLRIAAWREICTILNPNFDELRKKERKEFGKFVSEKWNNIQDTWQKRMKRKKNEKRSGSAAKRSRNYVHEEQFMFLKKIYEPRPTEESIQKLLEPFSADPPLRLIRPCLSAAVLENNDEETVNENSDGDDEPLTQISCTNAKNAFDIAFRYIEQNSTSTPIDRWWINKWRNTAAKSRISSAKQKSITDFSKVLIRFEHQRSFWLWIGSDHNVDKSIEILKLWIDDFKHEYHSIYTNFTNDTKYDDETGETHWSSLRYKNVISLRESGLNYARAIWADFLLTVDADVFLTDPNVLNELISKDLTIVAPLLQSNGLYSNFWGAMTSDYYYERSEDYESILYRQSKGCFNVPMVHSCVLLNMKSVETDDLTYVPEKISNYDGPHDDIIAFALSANKSQISLNLCNEKVYGFVMVPLEEVDQLEADYQQLTNLKLEVLVEHEPLPVNPLFQSYVKLPNKDTLSFDKIYMINLLRRSDRRNRMYSCFDELGLKVTTFNAVDGKKLSEGDLENITFMPDYADPYHKRQMTLGEVGCFLSHYNIWKEVVQNRFETVLILEDDIRFEAYFRAKVERVLEELKVIGNWDLVYFGRKRLQEKDEPFIEGSQMLVKVGYSYWTLGYILSLNGAQKLLDAKPLNNLVPVDEYLPILFNRHPESTWKEYYPVRDLIAFSVAPLLLYPTHYTGEDGYISDTEDSSVIKVSSTAPRTDL
ncbi:hypothetical protein FQA39_LY10168 [Lamprigera yunnana]|nr:hypothetical protein FQA39_LY10168 [Lamprigera yunnana]